MDLPAWGDAPLEDSISPLQESHPDSLRENSLADTPPAEEVPDDDEEEEFIYPTQSAPVYPPNIAMYYNLSHSFRPRWR